MGGIQVANQTFAEVTNSTGFNGSKFDGLFGFAYPSLTRPRSESTLPKYDSTRTRFCTSLLLLAQLVFIYQFNFNIIVVVYLFILVF